MIRVQNVVKSYGEGAARVDALRGVSLQIAAGQFVSIMGPSGSGKSTLLNLLAALDVPTSGSISIAGQDIAQLNDDDLTLFRRRKIGLVFQFFNLLPTLNALDNVLLPVMFERRVTRADRERGTQLLEQVGLRTRTKHHVHQLSGGEMQRVALARALILEPKLILADEPTGNLDSATGASILALLGQLCSAHGTTIVMVTHDRTAADAGDRLVSLKDGCLVTDDRVRELPLAAGAAE
jgi:putative ABC transport system ATP-binding protein